MILSYKYPLYPTNEQKETIDQWLGCQRFVWNYFLALNKKRYAKKKKFVFYNEMSKKLTQLKKERTFLSECPSQTLQQTLKHLEKAIKDVWQQGFGFPKFKSFYDQSSSFCFPQCFSLSTNHVYLSKTLKDGIRFHKYRYFVGKPKTCTVKKEGNKYFLILTCERKDISVTIPKTPKTTGIDVGTVRFYTRSDGKYFKSLGLEKLERRKRQLQKELERRTKRTRKGKMKKEQSNRRLETREKLSAISRHLANVRKDKLQKKTTFLINKYDIIVAEDLNTKGMTKATGKAHKKSLNYNILQQGWSMFFSMLKYKAPREGRIFLQVAPQYTSQTCSNCGCTSKKNRQSQSKFLCKDCGHTENADKNAAKNIEFRGLVKLGLAA